MSKAKLSIRVRLANGDIEQLANVVRVSARYTDEGLVEYLTVETSRGTVSYNKNTVAEFVTV